MAEIPVTEQLKDLGLDTLINIKESIVNIINSFINGFAPNNPVEFVFIISVFIGIALKRWKKESWTYFIVSTLMVYWSLRFLGVGS